MTVYSAPATRRSSRGRKRSAALALTAIGAALLLWSGAIHLYLWNDGFRHIPKIGPLFLAQGVIAIVLAAAVLVLRSVWAALLGALLLAGTAVGLLISVWVGLFNYHEHLATPYAGMSLVVEFVGAAVLVAAGGLLTRRSVARSVR